MSLEENYGFNTTTFYSNDEEFHITPDNFEFQHDYVLLKHGFFFVLLGSLGGFNTTTFYSNRREHE